MQFFSNKLEFLCFFRMNKLNIESLKNTKIHVRNINEVFCIVVILLLFGSTDCLLFSTCNEPTGTARSYLLFLYNRMFQLYKNNY